MTGRAPASWPRWAARVRAAVVLLAIAAFWWHGAWHTRLWIGSSYARAHGPLAGFDEILAPLGVPSPAARIAEVVAEAPADKTVAFVGEGPDFPFMLAVVNLLSYPRPFMGWQCVHPAAPAQPYYGWRATAPDGIVLVYRPQGLPERHARRSVGRRLLALRRPERYPPPERLCESVPEPAGDGH